VLLSVSLCVCLSLCVCEPDGHDRHTRHTRQACFGTIDGHRGGPLTVALCLFLRPCLPVCVSVRPPICPSVRPSGWLVGCMYGSRSLCFSGSTWLAVAVALSLSSAACWGSQRQEQPAGGRCGQVRVHPSRRIRVHGVSRCRCARARRGFVLTSSSAPPCLQPEEDDAGHRGEGAREDVWCLRPLLWLVLGDDERLHGEGHLLLRLRCVSSPLSMARSPGRQPAGSKTDGAQRARAPHR
jgi:hypothetical protein